MRLFGLTVTRNEEDRYLVPMLLGALRLVDRMFVFDDRSDDATADIASAVGCEVAVCGLQTPPFLEHEGRFREEAWRAFEEAIEPQPGDWVLSLDADEILVGPRLVPTLRYELPVAAAADHADGVTLPVGEVFAVEDGRPQVRIDGFWGSISAPRLFAYRSGGVFPSLAMGCGSVPTYVTAGRLWPAPPGLAILHFGYLDESDRLERYERYQRHPVGHSQAHIASILQRPVLRPWEGHVDVLVRG